MRATASRADSALAVTSTMRASPSGVRWESPLSGDSPRGGGMRGGRRRDQAGAWEEWVWLDWRMMASIRSLAISFSFLTSLTRHC